MPIRATSPVFLKKSPKVYPRDVPIIILGGSPHIVDEPPRFAQKISARMTGTGSKSSIRASSSVTAARNRMTVILSINIDSTADKTMNDMRMGTGL